MFKALQPLLTERSIHILMSSTKDGRINVFVEPVKLNDKEDNAFVTPFRCTGTPEELNAELPPVLAKWLETRASVTQSLSECLAEAEAAAKAAAEEAKKKAAERSTLKKPGAAKPVTPAKPAVKASIAVGSTTPSLLDDLTTATEGTVGHDDGKGTEDDDENLVAAEAKPDIAPESPPSDGVVESAPDASPIGVGTATPPAAPEAPQATIVASGDMIPVQLF